MGAEVKPDLKLVERTDKEPRNASSASYNSVQLIDPAILLTPIADFTGVRVPSAENFKFIRDRSRLVEILSGVTEESESYIPEDIDPNDLEYQSLLKAVPTYNKPDLAERLFAARTLQGLLRPEEIPVVRALFDSPQAEERALAFIALLPSRSPNELSAIEDYCSAIFAGSEKPFSNNHVFKDRILEILKDPSEKPLIRLAAALLLHNEKLDSDADRTRIEILRDNLKAPNHIRLMTAKALLNLPDVMSTLESIPKIRASLNNAARDRLIQNINDVNFRSQVVKALLSFNPNSYAAANPDDTLLARAVERKLPELEKDSLLTSKLKKLLHSGDTDLALASSLLLHQSSWPAELQATRSKLMGEALRNSKLSDTARGLVLKALLSLNSPESLAEHSKTVAATMRKSDIPLLHSSLESSNPREFAFAALALANSERGKSDRVLLDQIETVSYSNSIVVDSELANELKTAIRESGARGKTVAAILLLHHEKNSGNRNIARESLTDLIVDKTLPRPIRTVAIKALLNDPEPFYRLENALDLHMFLNSQDKEVIAALIKEGPPETRAAGCLALFRDDLNWGGPEAHKFIKELLRNQTDQPESVRKFASKLIRSSTPDLRLLGVVLLSGKNSGKLKNLRLAALAELYASNTLHPELRSLNTEAFVFVSGSPEPADKGKASLLDVSGKKIRETIRTANYTRTADRHIELSIGTGEKSVLTGLGMPLGAEPNASYTKRSLVIKSGHVRVAEMDRLTKLLSDPEQASREPASMYIPDSSTLNEIQVVVTDSRKNGGELTFILPGPVAMRLHRVVTNGSGPDISAKDHLFILGATTNRHDSNPYLIEIWRGDHAVDSTTSDIKEKERPAYHKAASDFPPNLRTTDRSTLREHAGRFLSRLRERIRAGMYDPEETVLPQETIALIDNYLGINSDMLESSSSEHSGLLARRELLMRFERYQIVSGTTESMLAELGKMARAGVYADFSTIRRDAWQILLNEFELAERAASASGKNAIPDQVIRTGSVNGRRR
ncbi:MAG: hypothetical protein D6719_04100 [Candidatus Dadabacteria bacterium]|nr:MAG: hypothetical protein D6719_04100 [Candidatus Dadabacteria bacterium]